MTLLNFRISVINIDMSVEIALLERPLKGSHIVWPRKLIKASLANKPFKFQDVMVVGEPSLMGGEFGDEDERLITRLENTQYEGDGVEWSAPPPASPAKTPPGNH